MSKKLNIQHVDFGFQFNATFNNISVVSFIGVPKKTTDLAHTNFITSPGWKFRLWQEKRYNA